MEIKVPDKTTNDVMIIILILLGISERTFENALVEVKEEKFL